MTDIKKIEAAIMFFGFFIADFFEGDLALRLSITRPELLPLSQPFNYNQLLRQV
ncbi:MAG: hypothetical protein H0U73_08765 [Tatlockia sp.]|nr:hypothetical protein [Tatlockia sp.]